MLIIRNNQMKAFHKSALQRFEDEMIVHSHNFAPKLSNVIGETQLRLAIGSAITRATEYGFTNRGPIRLFIEMIFLFGSSFDTDPQYPWATNILKNTSTGQMYRAEKLYNEIIYYQENVSGVNSENTIKALKTLSLLPHELLDDNNLDNFILGMRQELYRIFPQKAAYIGNEILQMLIQSAKVIAQQANFSTARNYALIVVLMYFFGHGCTNDPLYPWISNTLTDKDIVTPIARADRLEKKALTWLEHALAYLLD